MKAELGEGLRYVFTHRYQRGIVAAVALSNFFGQIVFSILLVYAVRELGLSAGMIGVVLAVGNIGTLAAALTARRISDRMGVGRTIVLAAFLFGPSTLLIALAPQDLAIPLITLSMLIIGFGGILFNVTMISLIQAITPDRILGRANASRRFVVWGVIPVRWPRRRCARLGDRSARDDGDRCRRRGARRRADPPLARPLGRTDVRARGSAAGRGAGVSHASSRWSLAASRLPLALVVADDQPVRLADQRAGATARRDRRARRERVRGRHARDGRVPAFPAPLAPGRRLGRPPPAPTDPRRGGHRPRGGARLGPHRLLVGRADDLAALRRRVRGRDRHGLLRRRLPVVPAHHRHARPAERRQLEARAQPVSGAARRPRCCGRADRRLDGARGRGRRRDQLRGLGAAGRAHPHGRARVAQRIAARSSPSSGKGFAT